MNSEISTSTDMKTNNTSLLLKPVMRPVAEDDLIRQELEGFIHSAYKNLFNAQLCGFLPNLVASTSIDDQIWAAFGYSDASQGSLFLESYLDESIEVLLSKKLGRKIPRNKIVEVGNLSITKASDSVKCMNDIASYLQGLGYDWIVCTATRYLRLLFLKSGAKPFSIAQANISRVQSNGTNWGSYYHTSPEILVGNVNQSVALIEHKMATAVKFPARGECINFNDNM